ncbi:MAG TPA: MFS transporter [Solirubrobacteraceae bacterium]|jgi:MFS family permease
MKTLGEMRRLLHQHDFRLLWLSQSTSVIGDQIVTVALALFVVQRTGSATDLGLVLAAHLLPMILFLLVGGVWADRLPRQRLMLGTDLVRFALHGALAVLILAGHAPIWCVAAIEVLFGTAEAFSRPAANGLLPQTVAEQDVQQATAITTMSNNVAEFAGPALATALVLTAGAGWAFAVDAATFLLSAAFLSRLHPRQRAPGSLASDTPGEQDDKGGSKGEGEDADEQPTASVWRDIREGAREVRERTWVWATLASFCGGVFFGVAPWFVLGPLVARQQYGHIGVYGVVQAALGLGTIIGSLAGLGWRPRYPLRAAMLAIMPVSLSAILYALGVTLVLVVPATVASGFGIALFDVWWLTALAERIPPQALSRVSSYDWTVSLALLPLGYLVAGPLAASFGSVEVLLWGSVLSAVWFLLGLLPRETRMLERLDDEPPALQQLGEEAVHSIVHHP